MDGILKTLEELCLLGGVSGREDNVREYIIKRIKTHSDVTVDALGNVTAFKKGAKKPVKKILFDAHMDEVGIIATHINPDGTVMFQTVGGINPQVIPGKRFLFSNGTVGVVGVTPIHLKEKGEEDVLPKSDDLYIEIGADCEAETAEYITPGDVAVFEPRFIEAGRLIVSKAIDDRAGCAVLIDMIESDLPYDAYFSFSVQEEIGSRGAGCVSFEVKPDISVALEATTASDLPKVKGSKAVCRVGKGAAVSFMDRGTVYDREIYELIMKTARDRSIAAQSKTAVAGGNNAAALSRSGAGSRAAAISVPCRYIHSPCCAADPDDIISVRKLARAFLSAANEEL